MEQTTTRGLPPGSSIDRGRPVAPQVYEAIRAAIIGNVLKPRQPLSEKDLAGSLGVSRTPAREALIRLADEGLVDILPRHGTFVSPVRLEQVFEAHAIREALEIKIVREAARRADISGAHRLEDGLAEQARAVARSDRDEFHRLDEAFHDALGDMAGLPRARRMIREAQVQLDRVRKLANMRDARIAAAAEDHAAILSAVAANDAAAAARAMQRHLDRSLAAVREIIRGEQAYFRGAA